MSNIFLLIFCFVTGTMLGSDSILSSSFFTTKSELVYSPGFEESPRKNNFNSEQYRAWMREALSNNLLQCSVPEYPDAGGNISNACFYTQPSVLVLAQELKKKVVTDGVTHLHIMGVDSGAGTLVNCLAKLAVFEKNYFEGTSITESDAGNIIKAVNQGSLVLKNPLIALQKTKQIARIATVFNVGIATSFCLIGSYFVPYIVAHKLLFIGLC